MTKTTCYYILFSYQDTFCFRKFIPREYLRFRKCLTQHRVSTNHGDKYLHDDFAFIDLISNIKYYIVSLFDSLWDSLWTKIFVRSRILILSSILAFKVWCRAKWIPVVGFWIWLRFYANSHAWIGFKRNKKLRHDK